MTSRSEKGSSGTTRDERPGEARPPGTVQALSQMIKDLEDQLDRVLAINEALEKNVAGERARSGEISRKLEEALRQLRHAERDAVAREDLLAEVAHLNEERTRLVRRIDELTGRLADAESESRSHLGAAERLRAGRADALEELRIVEAQFERAMEMVTDLKARVAVLGEENETLRRRLKSSEEERRRAEQERDALLAEVEESRTALDDIRRSLVDACVVSPSGWGDEDAR